jgi:hypothetical protein
MWTAAVDGKTGFQRRLLAPFSSAVGARLVSPEARSRLGQRVAISTPLCYKKITLRLPGKPQP